MKSIEQLRRALYVLNDGCGFIDSDTDFEGDLSAALDELAALRETNAENEKRLLAFIAENRELRWKVRQLESGGKLVGDNNESLVYVSELQWLRAENARMREAIKKHGEAYHVGECLKQDIEAPCTCGADDWNALVRSLQ